MWIKVFFNRSKYPINNIDDWYLTFVSDFPQQAPDSNDCGIFLLKACECIALKKPFSFKQEDMPRIRSEVAVDMFKKAGLTEQ